LVHWLLLPVYCDQMLLVGPIFPFSPLFKGSSLGNPILLLKTELYLLLSKRLLDFIRDLGGIQVAEGVRPSLLGKQNEKRAGLNSRKVRRRSFISNRIFSFLEDIALKRWSNALKSGD
jgi:hypothetical protein